MHISHYASMVSMHSSDKCIEDLILKQTTSALATTTIDSATAVGEKNEHG